MDSSASCVVEALQHTAFLGSHRVQQCGPVLAGWQGRLDESNLRGQRPYRVGYHSELGIHCGVIRSFREGESPDKPMLGQVFQGGENMMFRRHG